MMSISNIVVRRGCRKACSSALMRQRLSRATAIIAPPNHHRDPTMGRRHLTNSPPSIVVDRSLSPRQAAALEESILKELQQSLQDTILKTDIRTLGWLKNVTINNKVVKVVLRLPTLLHPHLKELESDIQRIVSQKVPPGFTVQVDTSATQPIPFVRNIQEHTELISNLGPGLSNVSHFLAVYSCKVRYKGKKTITTY
jgi:metal-sulfur cluster biosynthetic enzyme